jgi:hypothetical protein
MRRAFTPSSALPRFMMAGSMMSFAFEAGSQAHARNILHVARKINCAGDAKSYMSLRMKFLCPQRQQFS